MERQGTLRLRDLGYASDPGSVQQAGGHLVFYHFTHERHLDAILSPDGGLRPRRRVAYSPSPLMSFVLQGVLERWPTWLSASPWFGDFGAALFRQVVGSVPLRVTIPERFTDVWVADEAHILECKHLIQRGSAPLGLGYGCATGHDALASFQRSHIPILAYEGGHVAPSVNCYARNDGVLIPSSWIRPVDQ
jgi:hypothetical protein